MANFEGDKRSKYNIQNIHLDMVSLVKVKKRKKRKHFSSSHMSILPRTKCVNYQTCFQSTTLSGGGCEDAVTEVTW